MKTSEEWVEIFKADGDGESTPSPMQAYIKYFAALVQKDALLPIATESCLEDGKEGSWPTVQSFAEDKIRLVDEVICAFENRKRGSPKRETQLD